MTLTDKEKEFLLRVYTRQDTQDPVRPKQADPLVPAFQTLVDRGYMRVVRLMCALFRQPTGEVCFKLTEAGVQALNLAPPAPAEPTERRGIDL